MIIPHQIALQHTFNVPCFFAPCFKCFITSVEVNLVEAKAPLIVAIESKRDCTHRGVHSLFVSMLNFFHTVHSQLLEPKLVLATAYTTAPQRHNDTFSVRSFWICCGHVSRMHHCTVFLCFSPSCTDRRGQVCLINQDDPHSTTRILIR